MSGPRAPVVVNALLLLAALAGAVAVAFWMTATDPPDDAPTPRRRADAGRSDDAFLPISFGPFELDDHRLRAEWRREQAELEGMEPDEEGVALMREFYRVNAESHEPGTSDARDRALGQQLSRMAGEYVRRHGPRRYKAIGWLLAEEFETALAELAARARATGRSPAELLAESDARAQRWRERLGNFLDAAQRTGLVDGDGQLTAVPELAVVLFRYRWFSFAEDYANEVLMTPSERVAYTRWRIEGASGLPLQRRLSLVREVEGAYRDLGLDPDAVRGILYYDAGRLEEARAWFRRAQHHAPNDPRYPAWERAVGAPPSRAND
jgi:tetratricopeptide (TPR) repeat protein